MPIFTGDIAYDPALHRYLKEINPIWYGTLMNLVGVCGTMAMFGSVRATPIYVPFDCYVDRVKFIISVVAGNVRVAIYDELNGVPNNLIVESASIPCPPVSAWREITFTNTLLKAGMYFIAFQASDPAQTIWYFNTLGAMAVGENARYDRAWAYGAFPNPYGAGAWDANGMVCRLVVNKVI